MSLFVEPKTQKIERHWETKCVAPLALFTNHEQQVVLIQPFFGGQSRETSRLRQVDSEVSLAH